MRFMLTFTWKRPPDAEVMALMPAEQARATELADQGVTEEANIAADQSTFWAVWNLASHDDVQATLKTLPLYDYMDILVSPLAEPEQ